MSEEEREEYPFSEEEKQKALMMNFKALQRTINEPDFPKEEPIEHLLYGWEIEGVVDAIEKAEKWDNLLDAIREPWKMWVEYSSKEEMKQHIKTLREFIQKAFRVEKALSELENFPKQTEITDGIKKAINEGRISRLYNPPEITVWKMKIKGILDPKGEEE